MPSDLVRAVLTLWLLTLAVIDVRRRTLPHVLTTLPLLIVGGWFSIRALAPIVGVPIPDKNWDDVAVFLAFTAVLLSDTWLAGLPALTAIGAAFILGGSAGQVIVLVWLAALTMSKAGFLGEGDAKIIMILMALYPDARLAVCLVVVISVIGAALMVIRLRAAMPTWLLSIALDLLTVKVPACTGEVGALNVPLAPLLALGALIYLWGVL